MSVDVDIYEMKTTLDEFTRQSWIEIQTDKAVGIVEFNNCPTNIKAKLKKLGYGVEDRILVVIQG